MDEADGGVKRQFGLRRLFTATTLFGIFLAVTIFALRILVDPIEFAQSLGYSGAGYVALASVLGIVLFPTVIFAVGLFFVRRANGALSAVYAIMTLVAALASMHFAYTVCNACVRILL